MKIFNNKSLKTIKKKIESANYNKIPERLRDEIAQDVSEWLCLDEARFQEFKSLGYDTREEVFKICVVNFWQKGFRFKSENYFYPIIMGEK